MIRLFCNLHALHLARLHVDGPAVLLPDLLKKQHVVPRVSPTAVLGFLIVISGFAVLRPCHWTLLDFVAKWPYGLHVSQKPQVNLLVPDEAGIVHPVQVFGVFEVLFALHRQDLDLANVGPCGDHALLPKPGAALFGCCPSYFGDFAALEYHVQPAIVELQGPVLLLWATFW